MTNDKKLSKKTFPEQVENNQAPTSNSWLDRETPGATENDLTWEEEGQTPRVGPALNN